jgi:hypothetical protein
MSKQAILKKRGTWALLAALAVFASYLAVGASPAHALAWPETPDDTWMTNGTVFDTQLSEDGKTLYIGGRFSTVRENPPGQTGLTVRVNNLAAIDVATGEPVRTWRPAVAGDGVRVRELAVKNGKVYVGGNFSAVNGTPRHNLAAVDAVDGTLDPDFNPNVANRDGSAAFVYAMLATDSKLYVGGRFNLVDGQSRPHLAALNPATGALDSAWRPRTPALVWDLEFSADGATIFATGKFRSVTGSNGVTEQRAVIARLYTDTGNVHPWVATGGTLDYDPQTGHDLTVTPTRVYAGLGAQSPNFVAAFRLDNGNDGSQVWRFFTVGNVQTVELAPDGSRLFFGGHFGLYRLQQTVCGKSLQGLASLNPANGQVYCDWLPQTDRKRNGPWDMTMLGSNQLWLGGDFGQVSGVSQTNLARFTYGRLLSQSTNAGALR